MATNLISNLHLLRKTSTVFLPLPITRVNCPAMSPSEMGAPEESPSQGGGLLDWKPSGAGSLSVPVFVESEGEVVVSEAVCAAVGGL